MEHHQRNRRQPRITGMFTRYFRMPDGFDNFVYSARCSRGWRSRPPSSTGVTCADLHGTLYWQLNDLVAGVLVVVAGDGPLEAAALLRQAFMRRRWCRCSRPTTSRGG